MKKVSIIIPHYNSVSRLKILLNSIPKENWLEVIVVDDNSSVDIFSLENEFNHISFLKSSGINKGAGAARNIGLKAASGDYLLFADADDFFLEDAFDLIKKHKEQQFDIVFFCPTSLKLSTNEVGTRHKQYVSLIDAYIETPKKETLFKFYVPWSKLISSKLVNENEIQFDEVLASNDVMFSLKTGFYASKILCVKEKIYCVTESERSLMTQTSEDVIDSRFDATIRYNNFLREKGLDTFQDAMSGHLWNTRHFGLYKFLYRFFYCKYKRYPVFYGFKHFVLALKRFMKSLF